MRPPHDQTLVIFGGSGDLSRRKLAPALAALGAGGLLPGDLQIIGTGRSALADEDFRRLLMEAAPEKPAACFREARFVRMDPAEPAAYAALAQALAGRMQLPLAYYLAVPPALYLPIVNSLTAAGLGGRGAVPRRIIIEKPFGSDLDGARALNSALLAGFTEQEIFRIDHYLGKETAQNLLVIRFGNGIFEPLWNRNYIHHVEITAAESLGVENRAGYYDGSGALRDMVQNHLLQLAALVAMEPPAAFTMEQVRNETMKVLDSLRPLTREEIVTRVIRGQYTAATVRGEHLPGYREEKQIPADSHTETYAALRFFIDNWRWSGVPFYVRTGKRLPTRVTEIVIHFWKMPHSLFKHHDLTEANALVIRIQPDEGILLKLAMKIPGAGFDTRMVDMSFHYDSLQEGRLPSAYERLLLDAMHGDGTLYPRRDAVERCWEFITPVLEAWQDNQEIPLYGYPAGSWGPEAADRLIAPPDTWRAPCRNLDQDGTYCQL